MTAPPLPPGSPFRCLLSGAWLAAGLCAACAPAGPVLVPRAYLGGAVVLDTPAAWPSAVLYPAAPHDPSRTRPTLLVGHRTGNYVSVEVRNLPYVAVTELSANRVMGFYYKNNRDVKFLSLRTDTATNTLTLDALVRRLTHPKKTCYVRQVLRIDPTQWTKLEFCGVDGAAFRDTVRWMAASLRRRP